MASKIMEVSYTLHKFFNDDMIEELGVVEIKREGKSQVS
jgi:hypothetical protein